MTDIANNVPAGLCNTLTGATINTYAYALSWPCLGYGKKNIHLSNTDGANALKYKVWTYAYASGVYYEEVAETIIAAGNRAQIILEQAYASVVVMVKSSIGDAHATYQLDYVGNRGGL